MKNKLLILFILLLFPVVAKAANHTYLYDVLKNAAEEGTLAKEYTGEHNDSVTPGNKKIYYWYSDSQQVTSAIQNKYNVIFAGKCWNTIRTTDGGGTKLIYNGIAENNQCLDNRVFVGEYETMYPTSFYNAYVFGNSYSFNESDKKYYLQDAGNVITVNENNYRDIIGKYTCMNQDATQGCDQLYYVYDYAYTYINSITNYRADYYTVITKRYQNNSSSNAGLSYGIGYSAYTFNVNYPETTGYMYDDVDHDKLKIESKSEPFGSLTVSMTEIDYSKYTVSENNSYYPFSYDTSNESWTATPGSYAKSKMNFKINHTGDLALNYGFNTNYVDLRLYQNGNLIKSIEYANSILSNRKVIIKDVTPDDEFEIEFENRYSGSATIYFYFGTISGDITDTRMVFGNSFEYNNGTYKLKNLLYNDGTDDISYNHYTCLTTSDECEEIYYALNATETRNGPAQSVIKLTDGNGIEYYLNELLYKDDINKKDSLVKIFVDNWFEKNMLNYEKYLEPTVYCNRRVMANKNNYFNPNGGKKSPEFYASSYDSRNYEETTTNNYLFNKNLGCPLETDRFSVLNSKAKLKYSVALPTSEELILGAPKSVSYFIFTKQDTYRSMSPYSGMTVYTTAFYSHSSYDYGENTRLIRPVVTLKGNVEYESGTGTKEDPYIISDVMYSAITKENDDNKGTLTISGETEDVRNNTEVSFTVDKKKGFEVKKVKVLDDFGNEVELTQTGDTYKFNMPTSDVRVIVEYNELLSVLNTLKNSSPAIAAVIIVLLGYGTYLLIKNKKKSK